MSASPHNVLGLDRVVAILARRYAFDPVGRIAGFAERDEGRTPRFVLGRAREGVVWRFRADVDPSLVVEIGRLAAREKGFPIDGTTPQEPERLAAIRKRVDRAVPMAPVEGRTPHSDPVDGQPGSGSAGLLARHEWVSHEGVVVGELWTIE
jgi:hypothetical protein